MMPAEYRRTLPMAFLECWSHARGAVAQSARQAGLPGSASSNWTGAIPKRPMMAGSFAFFFTPS
jgi:hypothetical protein